MASNSFISCLLLLLYLTFIPTAFSADKTGDDYINQICDSSISGTFTSESQYAANLNNLLNDLVANTSLNNGFMNASSKVGTNESEYAYGHALCRHDVSPGDCNQCLNNASSTINASCSSMEARIWHYHCLLTYSNQNDSIGDYSMYHKENGSDTSTHGHSFHNKTLALFHKLGLEIARQPETLLFASGNKTYGNETIYGMVQCTRDQSVEGCKYCLHLATIRGIDYVSSISKGGTVYSGKCIERYEMFPFLLN